MRNESGSTIIIEHTATHTTIYVPDVALIVLPMLFLTILTSSLCLILALRRA